VWIFDLDNTLYPAECNLFAQVDQRMGEFIARFLGVPFAHARHLQKTYYRQFGTTLSGLMRVHRMDPAAFLDYVHDIDLSVVPEHPELAVAIGALPGRKLIYTNGSVAHARNVMDRLGINRHFNDIFDIAAGNYDPKPSTASFARLIEAHGIDPKRAAMFDDMARNLKPAAELGMTTILVSSPNDWAQPVGDETDFIHYTTDRLADWLAAITTAAATTTGNQQTGN
jgi:putative hydrolase of the HAD superfamily